MNFSLGKLHIFFKLQRRQKKSALTGLLGCVCLYGDLNKMGPAIVTGRKRPAKPGNQMRAQKRKRADVDVEQLEQAVTALVSLST